MSGRLILNYSSTIALITALILKLWAIIYNLKASTLLIILLYLIKDQ